MRRVVYNRGCVVIVEEYSASHGEPMTKHELKTVLKQVKANEMRLILRALRLDTARREENEDLRTMLSYELRRRQCRVE